MFQAKRVNVSLLNILLETIVKKHNIKFFCSVEAYSNQLSSPLCEVDYTPVGGVSMKSFIFNFIAVLGGLVIGSIVNMALVSLGGELIPPPIGADVSSMEELKKAMPLFTAQHFLFPFLAHAMGTLCGAAFAAKVASTHKLIIALVIGVAFLAGGIMMVFSLPSPMWFNVLDLSAAYLPMAYIGYKLIKKKDQPEAQSA